MEDEEEGDDSFLESAEQDAVGEKTDGRGRGPKKDVGDQLGPEP